MAMTDERIITAAAITSVKHLMVRNFSTAQSTAATVNDNSRYRIFHTENLKDAQSNDYKFNFKANPSIIKGTRSARTALSLIKMRMPCSAFAIKYRIDKRSNEKEYTYQIFSILINAMSVLS